MIVRAIQSIAVLSVVAVVAISLYCGAVGIRSLEDFRNYRAMRSVDDPIVVALAAGALPAGSTTQEMLAIASPQWTENYGRCVIYGFKPKQSYDHQSIATVDGRVVSARVGSCTWRWSFYDDMPTDIAESVSNVRGLRSAIERMPEHAAILHPLLDAELVALGGSSGTADDEAEQCDGRGAADNAF